MHSSIFTANFTNRKILKSSLCNSVSAFSAANNLNHKVQGTQAAAVWWREDNKNLKKKTNTTNDKIAQAGERGKEAAREAAVPVKA